MRIQVFRMIQIGLLVLLPLLPIQAATPAADKTVLIINSYHRGFTWSDAEESGFTERLQAAYPSVDIPIEFMDAKRHPDPSTLRHIKKLLLSKYRGEKIDLVVAFDNPALDMLARYRDELFPEVPVVFAGVSDFEQSLLRGRKRVTGVVEIQDVWSTLDMALLFHPGAKEVLIINDTTISGLSLRREVEAMIPSFVRRVKIRFLPPSTFEEAQAEIRSLPPDGIVLITSFSTDRKGRTASLAESTRIFTTAAKVPVYGVHETRLGHGIVGGSLLGGRDHGRRAADLALRILAGEDPAAIPVDTRGTAVPMFDFVQLKRFGIVPQYLPAGSIIVNKPDSIFDKYRGLMIGIILVVTSLGTMVIVLAAAIVRRKRAEESLIESEHRFRVLSAAPFEGIALSENGILKDVNDQLAGMLGCGRSELIGQPVKRFIAPEHHALVADAIRSGRLELYENLLVRKDGSTFLVESRARTIQLGGRQVRLTAIRDITERKQAESEQAKLKEQLFQSQKMETVGLLAGGVAHDFNNLLTPILGYGEMLLRAFPADDPNRVKLEYIKQAAELARELTRRLLAFGRKQVFEFRVVKLGNVINDFDPMLHRTIHENIQIRINTALSEGIVRVDTGQIEQVLLNLAINAQDAMPAGGVLSIEARDIDLDESYISTHLEVIPGPYVMLSVSDTGTGMDEQTREHIFEPFFTTKKSGRGTGLGLATVYGIVKQHGGSLSVYSEKDLGTVFKIYLPRVVEQGTMTASHPRQVNEFERGTETVLVVEDNEMVRTLACTMLQGLGYQVLIAANAAHGIDIAQQHSRSIDLLLTDVVMPKMNGNELYELLKRDRPDLKVLFMSGHSQNVIGQHGVLDEGIHLLQKPFTQSALSQLVRKVFAS